MADAQQQVVPEAESPQEPPVAPATPPDYLLEPNAVLLDNCRWRHGQVLCCCYVVAIFALVFGNFMTVLGPSYTLGEFCFPLQVPDYSKANASFLKGRVTARGSSRAIKELVVHCWTLTCRANHCSCSWLIGGDSVKSCQKLGERGVIQDA